MTVQHLEFLSLKGGCTGSSKSTLVKMPHCWKPHVAAHVSCALMKLMIVLCSNTFCPTQLNNEKWDFLQVCGIRLEHSFSVEFFFILFLRVFRFDIILFNFNILL